MSFLRIQKLKSDFRSLREKTGARFFGYKQSVVARRIKRRMYLRGISSVKDYARRVANDDAEAAALAADLMIGVTAFFRDRVAWRALRIEVVNKIAAEDAVAPLRIWTPACATGEESYSIAMMLRHELERAGRKREIQVFATDVSEIALERARRGKYPRTIAADVPPEFLRDFFTVDEDGPSFVVNKEIRECVVFAKHDLLADPPFSRLDAIICRNLLIYLDADAQEKCISLFHYALKEGGYLFLGNAESVGGRYRLFRSLGHKQCRIYRKLESRLAALHPPAVPFDIEGAESLSTGQSAVRENPPGIIALIQEALLEEYTPAAIAVDQHLSIVYHNGPTNRYLRQPRGAPTRDLLELIPETLRNRLRGALYRSAREAKTVSIRATMPDASQRDNPRHRRVTVRVSKLRDSLFLIVFRKNGPDNPTDAPAPETAAVEEAAMRQLESELNATRQDLQTHIEQLKTVNEELQSSNEELEAANEELETSREELQSLNEELVTVNAQLQSKIEEQDATNNDLNNFLAGTSIPTLFLDTQLRVKRFTPAVSQFLTLIGADVGRHVAMFQERLGPELIADSQSVLDRLAPVRRELMIDDAWYVRTALPYRTIDNRIEGVVVTYGDVTELKRAEERSWRLASFPELNPNPVLEFDHSGRITYFNPATEAVLKDLGMETETVDLDLFKPEDFDGILKEWDRKTEVTLYREVTIGDRSFAETVQLVPRFSVARIYSYEITKRKQAEEAIMRAKLEWERTFDSVPDLIAILDNDHRIVRVNRAMARRLGVNPGECVGQRCYENIHGLACPPDFCPHVLTMKDGAGHFQEVREERLGGEFLVSTTPLFDDRGTITGSVHVAHDITERKNAEAAIQRYLEELKTSNEELTRFNRAAVGRELRMIELKKEVNDLCALAGQPSRYALDFGTEE